MGDYKSAVSAFQKGLALDPNNDHMKLGLQRAEAQVDAHPERSSADAEPTNAETDPSAGLGGLADMLRNMGGGGGGGAGGMPDLAGIMNNPMMMEMAQQMMQNGGVERLMSNPAVANMVKAPKLLFPFEVERTGSFR
jgi:small glutamine-rich tetratricopeptide repeat-containing protein alpha